MAVFSSIAAAITAISTWTVSLGALGSFAIGQFILRGIVTLGLNALTRALMGTGDQKSTPFSIQGQLRAGGAVARSFMMGTSLTGGSLAWHASWGKAGNHPNAYYTQVIAVSDVPVAGLKRVFVNGAAVTLDSVEVDKGFPVLEFRKSKTTTQWVSTPQEGVEPRDWPKTLKTTVVHTDYMWIRFYTGTQTVADSYMVNTVGPASGEEYGASRVGNGIAYAIVTSRINQELFTGFPTCKFVVEGIPLYDISKDSTQGGVGSHRWDDLNTWGGDGDGFPAVQAYNLLRGVRYGGDWVYGMQGVAAARLPAAHWIPQIEKCRTPIEGADGLEPTFRSAGEVLFDVELGDTLDRVMTTCSGRIAEVGGATRRMWAPLMRRLCQSLMVISSQPHRRV